MKKKWQFVLFYGDDTHENLDFGLVSLLVSHDKTLRRVKTKKRRKREEVTDSYGGICKCPVCTGSSS